MAVKIRLTRMGDKKSPFYRIVVADSRKARDGEYVDLLGTFNPLTSPEEIKVDAAKAEDWLKKGAQPTDTAKALLVKAKVNFPAKKVKAKKAKAEVKAEAPKAAAKKPATKKTTAKKAKAE
ncbi:MAG: 30S ribosomal protein S16 [Clostridia bacterium]|nr:30S ribosomal protein S16 [Clostridia bacterium]